MIAAVIVCMKNGRKEKGWDEAAHEQEAEAPKIIITYLFTTGAANVALSHNKGSLASDVREPLLLEVKGQSGLQSAAPELICPVGLLSRPRL